MARRRESGAVADRPAGGQVQTGSEPTAAQPAGSVTGPGAGTSRGPDGGPSLDQIAQRAYEIYQSRGGTDGQDMEDWLQAERELRRGSED